MHTSRLSQLAITVATASALLFATMPFVTKMGALTSRVSFPLFLLGGLLGLIGLVLALVALYATRPAKGRAGRGLAWGACALGVAVLAGIAVAASAGRGAPPINDITTDPGDPPQFAALATEGPNAGRDMSYPGESFASQQRAAYPDLAPIEFPAPPDKAFVTAKRTMVGLGWKIVAEDPAAGTIEATETSHIFRFVDDIAVRVRPAPNGSRIDMRSKSREGRGDLGVNAGRIRALRDRLRLATLD